MLKRTLFVGITFCLLFTTNNLLAQTSTLAYAYDEFSMTKAAVNIQMDDEDLTNIFFTDAVNQLLFIDFEALGEEVSLLTVVSGETIFIKEDISKLPTNAIYEIDLKQLESGKNYKLLLNTPLGILTKEFKIQKKA
jgi:hypothetical protein